MTSFQSAALFLLQTEVSLLQEREEFSPGISENNEAVRRGNTGESIQIRRKLESSKWWRLLMSLAEQFTMNSLAENSNPSSITRE